MISAKASRAVTALSMPRVAHSKACDVARNSSRKRCSNREWGKAKPVSGAPDGAMRPGRGQPNSDPLGREARDRMYDPQSRYDPLGVPAAQRAQQVLEELRKRLSDPSRPQEELDYLERLMQRY